MRTLIIGDVHGCCIELQEMIHVVQPSKIILVGDMFTKGPNPLGVWKLIQKHKIESVLGNHDEAILTKKREDFPQEVYTYIENLPLIIELESCIIVHAGLNPHGVTTKQQAITIRCFPNDKNPQNPFWWEIITTKKLVVYGHDAKRGLQDHRPHTLGLDTGCVYGGVLTGYVLEQNTLVQIPAKRVYHPIREG
jgi:diadenosine tetraphosphatase ApaH/serine/threonine PP2A family protein phosphatase